MAAAGPARAVAITGCTRGIGRALFEWYAAQGYRVAGCGTSAAELKSLQAAVPGALVGAADLRDEGSVGRWIGEVAAKFGALDMLVCSAGVMPSPGSLWEIPEGEWRSAFDVNVLGNARVLRHAVPSLRAPGATVVLISSRYGRSVASGHGCYSATKWATESIAKSLALELQGKGVAVVSLDPGIVNTEMLHRSCPGAAAWCDEQRSPGDFAAAAGPFLLSLTIADTGRNLTCPGSPASYFLTGVAHNGRPAWASGIGPFTRAAEDAPAGEGEGPGPAKRRCTSVGAAVTPSPPSEALAGSAGMRPQGGRPRRYFISGIMLGSQRKLDDSAKDLAPQDYRGQIASAIKAADPDAEIVEPLDHVLARASSAGMTVEQMSADDAKVRELFNEVVDLVAGCDVIISNLPEASMGSAVELWEARKAGLLVFTVSPMLANWTIRSVTDHNFADLRDLEENLAAHLPR